MQQYQPHTTKEKRAYKEGFDFAVRVVMNAINEFIEDTIDEIFKGAVMDIKESMEDKIDYLINGN